MDAKFQIHFGSSHHLFWSMLFSDTPWFRRLPPENTYFVFTYLLVSPTDYKFLEGREYLLSVSVS